MLNKPSKHISCAAVKNILINKIEIEEKNQTSRHQSHPPLKRILLSTGFLWFVLPIIVMLSMIGITKLAGLYEGSQFVASLAGLFVSYQLLKLLDSKLAYKLDEK